MSRRERILAWAIGALVGLWALDQLVVQPAWAHYQSLVTEAARLEGDLRSAQVLVDNRAVIESRWRGYVASGLAADESTQRLRVQQRLTEWAQDAGLDLATLAIGRASAGERFDEVQFIVRGSGELEAIVPFLHELHRSPFPMRIVACEMGGRTGADDADQELALQLTLSTIRLAGEAVDGEAGEGGLTMREGRR